MAEDEKDRPEWVQTLPQTSDLVIGTAQGVLVRIKPDGTLEYGPDYEPDVAAQIFWDAMARQRVPYEEQRLVSQHVEGLVIRLGQADLHCEAMRLRASELVGTGTEGSVVIEAQRATHVVERIVHQLIELGRGLARRRADVNLVDVPTRVPAAVAGNPDSAYDPGDLPGDWEIGPRKGPAN